MERGTAQVFNHRQFETYGHSRGALERAAIEIAAITSSGTQPALGLYLCARHDDAAPDALLRDAV